MNTYKLLAVLLGLTWIVAAGCTSHAPPAKDEPRYQIARQYGLDGFDQVDAIRFTFNAQVGAKHIRRTWWWQPRTGDIRHQATDRTSAESFTHPLPEGTTDDRLRALDAKFINDRYWLLFPLHLAWDRSATVTDRGRAPLPLGTGEARLFEVGYPPTGGYTPGDVYEIYIGPEGQIVEWVYRRGGDAQPTRMSTWENHRRLGPLVVSLDHHGPDGFRVWFSDVSLKLAGEDGWRYPED